MKLVYRVENILGEGPYRTTNLKVDRYSSNKLQTYRKHPAPSQDAALGKTWYELTGGSDYRKWRFGFVTLEQLKAWFYTKESRKILHRNGFFISVYRVPNRMFHGGDTQAIFIRDSGKERMLKTISFDSLI